MSMLSRRWFMLGWSVMSVLALSLPAGAAEESSSAPVAELSASAANGPFVGIVTGSKVNIRAGANLNYEVLHKVAQGDQLVVTGQTGDWYAIELPADAPCYIAAKFVAQDGAGVGRITGNTVNVRGGPGTKYNVLGKVAAGEIVSITGAEGEWLRIVPPVSVRGWIAAAYLRPEPSAQVDAVRAVLASRRPAVAAGGIVPPTGAGVAHSPIALVSAPLAQGRLERARGFWKRPGTHQLVQERKTIAFLASEAIALDDYLHQDVAVWGSIADPSRAVPQITVTQVATSPAVAPAADVSTPQ